MKEETKEWLRKQWLGFIIASFFLSPIWAMIACHLYFYFKL